MNEKIGKILNFIWSGIVVISIMGITAFVLISCFMVWALALVLIKYINPDYDMSFLLKIISIMFKIIDIEIIIIIIHYCLIPPIKRIWERKHGK